MNKKGVAWQIISLALCVAVVIFVVYAFLAPGAALAKAKDEALSFGQEELSETGVVVPKSQEEPRIPSNIMSYFNNLVSKIKNPQDGEECLVNIGEVPELDEFVIVLSEGKIGFKQKKKEGIAEGLTGQLFNAVSIKGFKPCMVIGSEAVNFHNCFINNNKDDSCSKELFQLVDQIILEKGDYYSKFLFKSGENHCFIKLDNDFWGTCGSPRNGGANGIDISCRDNIEIIGECSESVQEEIQYTPVFVGGTFYDKQDKWVLEQNKYYYGGDDTRIPFMFTLRGKVYGGTAPLTKEKFNEIFSSESEEIPEKDGVYYEGVYYGPKEHWGFRKGGEFCGGMTQCWVYVGDDEEVPQEFRDKGINPDKKLSLFGPLRVE